MGLGDARLLPCFADGCNAGDRTMKSNHVPGCSSRQVGRAEVPKDLERLMIRDETLGLRPDLGDHPAERGKILVLQCEPSPDSRLRAKRSTLA